VARLEHLDELEEWRLLMRHYCLAWAATDPALAAAAAAAGTPPPAPPL
jgi:hypothetical protein